MKMKILWMIYQTSSVYWEKETQKLLLFDFFTQKGTKHEFYFIFFLKNNIF
jgi:hypothetical protein